MLHYDSGAVIHLFESSAEQLEKYREYGYVSAKATELKTLYYKLNAFEFPICEVIGYLTPANPKHAECCVVVSVEGKRGMIHKDYLKEMQEHRKKFEQAKPTMKPLF